MYSKLNQLSAVKQEVYVCQYCIESHYEITQFLEKYELENNALIWCIPKHMFQTTYLRKITTKYF